MWHTSLFPVSLTLLALVSSRTARAADNPDDASGKLLYITEPACGYYQCFVDWTQGEDVAVNWLGPAAGSVSVMLISTNGGPTYDVTDSIAGISQEGYCNSGGGLGVVQPGVECGRIEFTVPGGWRPRDNYTIAVQSLSDPSIIGYTDNINVIKGENVGSGTSVQLHTIAGPTSTNWNAAASFTGRIPDPTAVTGGGGGGAGGGGGKSKTRDSATQAPSSTQQPSSSDSNSDWSNKGSKSRSDSPSSTASSSSTEDPSSTSPAMASSILSLSSLSAGGGSLAAQGSSSSEGGAVATATPTSGSERTTSAGVGAVLSGLLGLLLL